jgi:hypothetical protein
MKKGKIGRKRKSEKKRRKEKKRDEKERTEKRRTLRTEFLFLGLDLQMNQNQPRHHPTPPHSSYFIFHSYVR